MNKLVLYFLTPKLYFLCFCCSFIRPEMNFIFYLNEQKNFGCQFLITSREFVTLIVTFCDANSDLLTRYVTFCNALLNNGKINQDYRKHKVIGKKYFEISRKNSSQKITLNFLFLSSLKNEVKKFTIDENFYFLEMTIDSFRNQMDEVQTSLLTSQEHVTLYLLPQPCLPA